MPEKTSLSSPRIMARSVFSTGLLLTTGVGSGAGDSEAVGLLVRLPDCAIADDPHTRNTIKNKSGRTGTVFQIIRFHPSAYHFQDVSATDRIVSPALRIETWFWYT